MTPSPRAASALLFIGIVFLGFLARAATTKSPLLDHHAWRQADTAAIARNFYRDEFSLLRPQVDWRGDAAKGYVATGVELHAYAVAALSLILGFRVSHGRLLSCLWFVGSATLLHRFLRERYGAATAIAGTGAYAFGFPLLLFMDRSFMNEPLLLMLTFCAYRAAQRHVATGRWAAFTVLAVATTLLGLIKAPYLIAWGGVLGLFIERHRAHTLRLWRLHALAAMNIAAVGLWYSYARTLGEQSGLSFGLSDKLYVGDVAWSLNFWSTMLGRLAKDVFGPIGLAALAWGAVQSVRERRWFEIAGLAAGLLYLVLVAQGNLVHDYYQLALVPVGAVLVAVGLERVARDVGRRSAAPPDRYASVLVAAVLLMALSAFLRSYNSWYGYAWEKLQVCQEGGKRTSASDLLVVLGDPNPELMFCLDRKGWIPPPGFVTVEHLDRLQRAGASLVLVSSRFQDRAVLDWLDARSGTLVRNSRYALLRLQ